MQQQVSRKNFLRLLSMGTGGLILLQPFANAQDNRINKPPALNSELVKEFVIACHGNFEKAKTLHAAEPGLLNSCWDWGGGDFETGLEGAGHVGNKEIARYLLENGARMNIFCAAMLGKIDIVRSILTAMPDLKSSKGPHGLQLLHHAKKGGEDTAEVLKYLESIGAS